MIRKKDMKEAIRELNKQGFTHHQIGAYKENRHSMIGTVPMFLNILLLSSVQKNEKNPYRIKRLELKSMRLSSGGEKITEQVKKYDKWLNQINHKLSNEQ